MGETSTGTPARHAYNSAMHTLLTLVAVGVGMLIAIQPALNTQLSRSLGHPWYGAATNFAVGLVVIALAGIVIVRPALPKGSDLAGAPWWAWGGGILGATFVTLAILLLPRLGAVLLIGSILVGQLVAASAIDQFGLLGVRQQTISPLRIVGLAFLLLGLVFVQAGTRTQSSDALIPPDGSTPSPHPPATTETSSPHR